MDDHSGSYGSGQPSTLIVFLRVNYRISTPFWHTTKLEATQTGFDPSRARCRRNHVRQNLQGNQNSFHGQPRKSILVLQKTVLPVQHNLHNVKPRRAIWVLNPWSLAMSNCSVEKANRFSSIHSLGWTWLARTAKPGEVVNSWVNLGRVFKSSWASGCEESPPKILTLAFGSCNMAN